AERTGLRGAASPGWYSRRASDGPPRTARATPRSRPGYASIASRLRLHCVQAGLERAELVLVDRVGVLRGREGAAAHLGGVGGDAGHHLIAQLAVALGEARRVPVVDAEQIVEHQHLAVGGGAGTD